MRQFLALFLFLGIVSITCGFPYENVTHSLQEPLKKLHPDLQSKPFPTGAFWTNFVLGQCNEVVVTYPYAVKIQKNQLHISYPFRVVTSKSIIQGFTPEIIVDIGTEPFQITRFDELSVTIMFSQSTSSKILLHLVRGSPYITLEYQNAVPTISSDVNILSMTETGNYSQVTLGNWHQWLLFGSSPLKWTSNGKTWSSPKLNGILRIALALHEDTKPVLAYHSTVYPIGAAITYEATSESNISFQFNWQTKNMDPSTSPPLLMTGLTHHLQTFEALQQLESKIQFTCMRGPLTGVLGDVWRMQEHVYDVPWDYDSTGIYTSPDSEEYNATVDYIKKSLVVDIARFPAFAQDSYNFGKQFGREARLVLIANRFNVSSVFDKGLEKLQNQIRLWLVGNNTDHFVYDQTYGGLITKHGFESQGEDFGNGYYNDHHFHYGYFLYGLAVIRRFNSSFIQQHENAIHYILSDIGSPVGNLTSFFSNFSQRKLFPSARHKDWYCGHSYASGLFPQANGKSQESSSESVNAYYSLALYTSLENEKNYYNYSRLLMAMEIRSIKLYWQISKQFPMIYEPIFAGNKMVGVVSEMDVVYSTWFGDRPAFIHGIQIIPITPITSYLLSPEYVVEERLVLDDLPVMMNPSDIWSSVVRLNSAIVHPKEMWMNLQSIQYNYDTWSSATNAMHWIASRPLTNVKATIESPPVCFGYPACAIAGAFGKSLDCCHTLPGCCPGDNPCCNSDVVPTNASNVCHSEPACGILGLTCCNSPEGCCKPTFTGQVLGCCKTQPPVNSTTKPHQESAQCFHQPKCAAAGLDCCRSPEGCCMPSPTSPLLGCCESPSTIETTSTPFTDTCHNEPVCATLGLDCCRSLDGCCKETPGKPKLNCCNSIEKSKVVDITTGNGVNQDICSANPSCLTAGPNNTPLACCSSLSGTGCCPGNRCCHSTWSMLHISLVILGTIAFGGLIYCGILYLRRKDYQPLGNDTRRFYCIFFMIIFFLLFFYLIIF